MMAPPPAQHKAQSVHDDSHTGGRGHPRPRKPDAETLSYIRSLEPQIEESIQRRQESRPRRARGAAESEDKDNEDEEGEDDQDGQDLLVSNLVEELTYKFASVSMDRHAAPILEKLARLSSRPQLARLLASCEGYVHSMAINRYSSHVLETLLSLVGPFVQLELEGGEDEVEAGEENQEQMSLKEAIVKVAHEMQASWPELIYDLCGSHSLRALLCVLTGMPVVAERRGRHSKHQHSVETAVSVLQHTGQQEGVRKNAAMSVSHDVPYRAKLDKYEVPDEFHMILESIVVELSRFRLMDLHQAICDPNSGPALCLLIQAVARSEGSQTFELSESGLMLGVITSALCHSNDPRFAEAVYAMSGEPSGSRFLEAVIWHTPLSMCNAIYSRCLEGSLMEYVKHEVANFVVQAWLQRTENVAQLKSALQELGPHFKELLHGRRGGVLWRLAGACLRLKRHEKKLVQFVTDALSPAEVADGTSSVLLVVRSLLGDMQVGDEDGRLRLNVTGARLLDCLMRYPFALAEPFCRAVVSLPHDTLVAVAKDNVGSRALLDPVLARAEGGTPESLSLVEALANGLKGRVGELAGHPVGFHVVTKCYVAAGAHVKLSMVTEMVGAESRLAGGHYGKRAMGLVNLALFKKDRGKWEKGLKEGEKKRKVLEEIFALIDQPKEKPEKRWRTSEDVASKLGRKVGPKEDVMALLMPGKREFAADDGTAAEEVLRGKKPHKKRKVGEENGGPDIDFVLDAIKATTSKNKEKRPTHQVEGMGSERADHDDGLPQKSPRPPANQAARKHHQEAASKKHGRRKDHAEGQGKPQNSSIRGPREETPVQKAKRLLGKRAMMSKGELLSAVLELESEIKTSQGRSRVQEHHKQE